MASLSTIAQQKLSDGRRYWTVTLNETAADVNTEITLTLPAAIGTVTLVASAYLLAGDGATIQPSIGVVSGFADANDLNFRTKKAAAAARYDADYSTVRIFGVVDGEIFLKPNCDAGVANTITGTLTFVEGIVS